MPVDDVLMDCEMHMEKAIEHLQHELKGIRTGRASPALVEHISVMYYEVPTPLKSIAAISVPEATQILIKPFSPGDLKAIEPAVYLLAAMAIITVFQRIFHVRSELNKPVTETL